MSGYLRPGPEEVESVELAGVHVAEERVELLDLERGIDAQVVLELGLDLGGDGRRVGQVLARDVAVAQGRLESVGEAGGLEDLRARPGSNPGIAAPPQAWSREHGSACVAMLEPVG